jgi:hypothetical protein
MPAIKKPVAKKSAAKKPVAKKPAAKKPVAKKPAAKKPAAKKPAAKKPVAKKPAAKKRVSHKGGANCDDPNDPKYMFPTCIAYRKNQASVNVPESVAKANQAAVAKTNNIYSPW